MRPRVVTRDAMGALASDARSVLYYSILKALRSPSTWAQPCAQHHSKAKLVHQPHQLLQWRLLFSSRAKGRE